MVAKVSKNDLPDVLEAEDIKKFLNIGINQTYELCNSGQFHVVRIGRRIRVSKQVFLNWFEGIQSSSDE
ncbi:helix-turn-helix domain-containing protein [Brevibacillus sp. FIR094]|uniref:helix-turn-helix domain-containing protein n=1 Tax=Brevibacillus sp. FIR094 TaxID=3134809 RepID=UPI003D1CE9C2